MSGELAVAEAARLAELEQVVERGLQTFVDVGQALLEIRRRELYRATHGSFESYCRARWNLTGRRGRQLIAAAEVGTIVPVPNEGQARELVPLLDEPDQLRDAWAEASANGDVTAAKVRAAVGRILRVPVSDELLERQQRGTLIAGLDRAVYALEGPPSTAEAEARRLLAGGDAGPFTPARFDRVAAYAEAFARALRTGGIDG